MSDFFSQLTEILSAEASRHPDRVGGEELKALLQDPRPAVRPLPPPPPPRPAYVPARPAYNTAPVSFAEVDCSQTGSLQEIAAMVNSCQRCGLCRTRTNTVPGEGDPHARLMFIGEGPGRDEDLQGRPFVGAAGQLLDKMISAMQFRREEVYIANVVKCRPPENRKPLPEEGGVCIGYLKRQIELVRPEVIVLLGATAAGFLLARPEGIMRLRGRWLEYNGIPVMPTFHPAYLLRNPSAKRDAWEDLKLVMHRMGKELPPPRRVAR